MQGRNGGGVVLHGVPPNPIPTEIDITCWDTDPLPEEEESFGGGL